jgi:hypothetical protein
VKSLRPNFRIGVNSFFTLLFICLISIPVLSQDLGNKYQRQLDSIVSTYDQDKLNQLYLEFSERYNRQKVEAETYALLNNIPLKRYNEDGTFDELQKLAEDGTPIYYTLYNVNASISTRANYLNSGGGLGLTVDGDNLTAHVWDGGPTRPTHQEFDGAGGTNRVTINDGQTTINGNSFHAMHVTGTIVASGFQAAAKGMAWQANALTHDWNNDVSEATTEAGNGMLVSNHSYGYQASGIPDSWFGQYGSDARDWDGLMYSAPNYLMLVAAGNDGNDNTSNGNPLDGQSAYDKLNGHATAKNNLVVANGLDANINPDGSLNSVSRNSGSSEGPTDDYRIKPDIMGNGTSLYSCFETSNSAYGTISGTSMATPNVTGSLLLLQEHYFDEFGSFMRAATLKGLALHTADDVSPSGPDAQTGWGLMNTKFAAETISTAAASSGSAIIDELTLSQGQSYQITVQSDGVNPLMASISWTDPAGSINNGTNSNTPALVNDLDIRLDNGSTFTPWRLTGVTTNGTGDNIVDPYERIDINSASGSYTITVTHKGSLSSGSQDYSLIVTGIVVATTPLISFGSTSGSFSEDTNCSYTDINVPLNIAQAPSANADVNFTINGSSSATNGLDFELMTSSVTFPTGSTASQNMVLRVHHDGFVESDETAVIDFTVNANGGDAAADTNADTYTLTINSDDAAPIATFTLDLLNEDFETAPAWTISDQDGDGYNWTIGTVPAGHLSTNQLYSRSWNGVPLTPDNYLITSQIIIPSNLTDLDLSYQVAPATLTNPWYQEYYTVYWATDISSIGAINASPQVKPGGIIAQAIVIENIDMSAYIGQTGYLVFRHHNCTDEEYIAIDDMLLQGTSETNVQTAVNDGTTNDQQDLPGAGTIYTSDSSSGDVMLNIANNNSHDYGCTDISVSRAGTGAQSYNGSTSPNLVMDKRFDIDPTNPAGSGNVTITFYFTEAEISGWESATGLSRTALEAARESGGSLLETSTLSIGSFGTHVTLTGTFTGLSDRFYFGPSGAFVFCMGVAKSWNGSNWVPSGAPGLSNSVVINGNYNTATHGDINACSLTVGSGRTLTVTANNFLNINGNITVDGTLIVEHQGSVVQADGNALVTNSGTINVELTTPVLQTRDWMVMGSPMSGETRGGVFGSAFLVLDHTPANFIPHGDVPAGGTNFADDNGDFWNQITVGTTSINVGEGYIVRPQSGYTDPANVNFYMTYSQGTLNNGDVTRSTVFNGLGTNPDGTPNVYSNPYASAISGTDFINANSLVNELYFWEHLTPPSPAIPGYGSINFSMGDISIFNLTMPLPAANDPGTSTTPNGIISTGQGFGIKAFGNGSVTFTNAMRRTTGNTTLRGPEENKDLITLRVFSPEYEIGSFTGIGFTQTGTPGIDPGYDSNRLATAISLYSHLLDGTRQLGIQTREAFESGIKVPMGFASQVDAEIEFTISIVDIAGEHLSNATVYLFDHLDNTITNLSQQDYIFKSDKGVFNERFTVLFEEESILGDHETVLEQIVLFPNPTRDILNIVSPLPIERISLYDIRGREILIQEFTHQGSYQLDLTELDTAMYFVQIDTDQGSITKRVTKK